MPYRSSPLRQRASNAPQRARVLTTLGVVAAAALTPLVGAAGSAPDADPLTLPTDRAMVTETVELATPGTEAAESSGDRPDLRSASLAAFAPVEVEPFALIGLSWAAGSDPGPARVRVRTAAGWGGWHELSTEETSSPDPVPAGPGSGPGEPVTAARVVSDPVWVGAADAFEVALTGPAQDLRIHIVRPGDEPAPAGNAAGGGAFDEVPAAVAAPRPDATPIDADPASVTPTAPGGTSPATPADAGPTPAAPATPGGPATAGSEGPARPDLAVAANPAPPAGGASGADRGRTPPPDAGFGGPDDGAAAATTPATPTVTTTGLQIHSRSEWGSRPAPPEGYDAAQAVRLAVLHHTVDTNAYGPGDVPAMLRAIQAFHTDVNGWYDIGYNFLVDRFGRVWQGRGGAAAVPVIGAHASGFNTGSVGVALLGDFRSAAPTQAAIDATVALLSWRLFLDGADPADPARLAPRSSEVFAAGQTVTLPRIVGHGDVNFTSCPAGVRAAFNEIRQRVAAGFGGLVSGAALNPYRLDDPPVATDAGTGATPLTPLTPLPGDFDGDGDEDLLWVAGDRAEFWLATGSSYQTRSRGVPSGRRPLVTDADGNGTSDVFWWSATAAAGNLIWMLDPGGAVREAPRPAADGLLPQPLDTDGDGDHELLWYHPVTGETYLWISIGPFGFQGADLPDRAPGLRPTVIDPDGDARDDVLWYDPSQATQEFWRFATAAEFTVSPVPAGPGDHTLQAADLDGDGYDDLVFTGTATTFVAWGPALDSPSTLAIGVPRQVLFADSDGGGAAELVTVGADGTAERRGFTPAREVVTFSSLSGIQGAVATADSDANGRDELYATSSGGFRRHSTG